MVKETKFTFIDLFAGIGGFRIALERLGGVCEGFSEIDKTAISVYKSHFDVSNEIEIGDITKAIELPKADILVGGVPCQSWSVAGKKRGFDDPRGKLWFDTIQVTEKISPKGFIYENVKGLADPRNKFNLDLILLEFDKIGYKVYPKVLNAFDYGLPQSRERLFLVGIRKDLDKGNFVFPTKNQTLPLLANILDDGVKKESRIVNSEGYKNSFNISSKANLGNCFTFCDTRNGAFTIHSWELVETSPKEKQICMAFLRNRRKPQYGTQDGNPLSLEDISVFVDNVTVSDLEDLVQKGILKNVTDKYEFSNSKNSAGINGIYRIFLKESHVFSTLTKTGTKDYVSEDPVPEQIKDKKQYFIDNIYLKKRFRKLTIREGAKLQGFPDDYKFNVSYDKAMGLLGNAVAVDVVEKVCDSLLNVL